MSTKTQHKADNAKRLLENELFNSAFNTIHDNLHKKWEQTKSDDFEARERIYNQLHALKEVRRYFEVCITDAIIETKRKEELSHVKSFDRSTGS